MVERVESHSVEIDREILIGMLAKRYGLVSDSLQSCIQHLEDEGLLKQLIHDAEREPNWHAFIQKWKHFSKG